MVATVAVVPLRRWRHRRRLAAEARTRATAVIELCTGLAAELRAGATADQALGSVIVRTSLWAGLGAEPAARLAAGRYGADIPAALRFVAELPGGQGAAAVAACWEVTAESGTGLAAGLDQLADALRAERALNEEIAGELAGPRTTIVVLGALPLIGLLLGAALGAKPIQVLLHRPIGLGCLVIGALLEAAGLAWTARIVRAAEAAGGLPARGGPVGRPEPPARRPVVEPDPARDEAATRDAGGRRRATDVQGCAIECGISRSRAGRAEVGW
ncbi:MULTISPECIES: type II secretion system F family protein [Kitasatospora]|uniref:type II secretion system F family protein n=1 Tax=Kitasatospora TaxID=2063 RepID=UPI0031DFE70B